jgi:putative two-component system response regulator
VKKQRVLIADDEQAIRFALKRLLEREGYEVVAATDGEEAIALFERTQPDLVLLDVMMPRMDGFQVCEHLKSDPERRLTPVIIVTASSKQENRLRGLDVGADDFISKPVDRVELSARVRSLLRIKGYIDELERAENVLFTLARSIEGKDPYTKGHCERLSIYAERLGSCLGASEEELAALRQAGVVHDVGKVGVPDAILLKPGPLTDQERLVVMEHPVIGERICSSLKSFKLVLPIIRHHHEKCDGNGYPDRLKRDEIPITARILSVVDVFDALTTERPYKKPFTLDNALQIMQEEVEKGWWDPQVFQIFRDLVTSEGFEPADESEAPDDELLSAAN